MFNDSGIGFDIGSLIGSLANRNGDGNGDFGNNGWWILIILFALWGGFGGEGFAGNRGGNNTQTVPATSADVQRGFDNQSVINKLNGLENGICSLGYDQLAQMNNLGTQIMGLGNTIQSMYQTGQMADMQRDFSLQQQFSNCCCENREAIAQVRYDMAMNNCNVINAINQAAQNIIQNDNCNYRQLHDENVAAQMAAKDEVIAQLRSQQNFCQTENLVNGVGNYIINRLNPTPIPSWQVPNPNAVWYNGYNNGCCGQNGFNYGVA